MNKEEITHSQSDETFTKNEVDKIIRITTEVIEKKIEYFVKDIGPCVTTVLDNLLRNVLKKMSTRS